MLQRAHQATRQGLSSGHSPASLPPLRRLLADPRSELSPLHLAG